MSLIIILLLQQKSCQKNDQLLPTIEIKRDTIYNTKDSIVYRVPKPIKNIPAPFDSSRITFKPKPEDSTWCKLLINAYDSLADNFYSMNIYSDTLDIDSIGYIAIKDSVVSNKIKGRSIKYNLQYPEIITTIEITKPAPLKKEFYLGGTLYNGNNLTGISSGLLYKDKKKNIFGISFGIINNQTIYSGSFYKKL